MPVREPPVRGPILGGLWRVLGHTKPNTIRRATTQSACLAPWRASGLTLQLAPGISTIRLVTVEDYAEEIEEALKNYERHVVCLQKTPEQFMESVHSLVGKAIAAYESRGEGLRHGIALDRQVTVILSQTDEERPLCGIYMNLSSPYARKNNLT